MAATIIGCGSVTTTILSRGTLAQRGCPLAQPRNAPMISSPSSTGKWLPSVKIARSMGAPMRPTTSGTVSVCPSRASTCAGFSMIVFHTTVPPATLAGRAAVSACDWVQAAGTTAANADALMKFRRYMASPCAVYGCVAARLQRKTPSAASCNCQRALESSLTHLGAMPIASGSAVLDDRPSGDGAVPRRSVEDGFELGRPHRRRGGVVLEQGRLMTRSAAIRQLDAAA